MGEFGGCIEDPESLSLREGEPVIFTLEAQVTRAKYRLKTLIM
jgi:hypothetical protein